MAPRGKALSTGLVYLARIIERMDEQLLPSVYFYVGCAFHASPSQLGTITLCRALVQALASPLGGILGGATPLDRRRSRSIAAT
jgi:hypothetical protein